jgi:hypothetical protein
VLRGAPGDVVSGSFTVHNEGNVGKHVVLSSTIPDATCSSAQFTLDPDDSQEVTCTARIPRYAPGNYSYVVRVIAS